MFSINHLRNNTLLPSTNYDYKLSKHRSAITIAVYTTLSILFIGCIFGCFIFIVKGKHSSIEYFTAFLVEESLSFDNLFVYYLLFDYFKIPYHLQNRVLNWGIIGAMLMRGLMIFIGVSAIQKFKVVTLLFAAIIIFSSYKLFNETDDNDSDIADNYVLKISKFFINSTELLDGERFFTNNYGKKAATPLFMCLICIEFSDLFFAVDSIPAVIGISHDTFIVYCSNIFAMLVLRSVYILIAKAISQLKYIRPAVALVLALVGIKMFADYFSYELSPLIALLIICIIIGGGIGLSLIIPSSVEKNR